LAVLLSSQLRLVIDTRELLTRDGLRHVRGVRLNGAADFRGPPLWTLKIPYKLTLISPLIAVLTKEPEMLQPDAFCEHTMQQNATAAGTPPWTPLGKLTALPQTL